MASVESKKRSPRTAARGLNVSYQNCARRQERLPDWIGRAGRRRGSLELLLLRLFLHLRSKRAGAVGPLCVGNELNVARVERELLVLALEVELQRLPARHGRQARRDWIDGHGGIGQSGHE